jgi:hypothetical protein
MDNYSVLYDYMKENETAYSVIEKSDQYSGRRYSVYARDLDESTATQIADALNLADSLRH